MNSNSKSFELSLTDISQLWVADRTHFRLLRKFIYLAAILDAHSRRCIGWGMSHKSDAQWTIKALEMALMNREIAPGRVHLSDRSG